jgi:predicted ester cyclase
MCPGLEACCTRERWAADREFHEDAVARWHTAFPDFTYHVEDLVAEGDTVAVEMLYTGTHQGVFHWAGYGPWAASGRQISLPEMFFMKMSHGQIAEWTATWNPDDLRQQLGISPSETNAAGRG